MAAEKNLQTLLQNMDPVRHGEYAFCVLDEAAFENLGIRPLATFQEAEGLTVIIPVSEADRSRLPYTYVGTLITLNVQSSLEAVGFLAKITGVLASAGISVNAFSPVYHDHLFVLSKDAERAMNLLRELTR